MNPEPKFDDEDTMRPEYDFDMSKAIRGKFAQRIREEGTNVILLDADVYEVYRDSESVNSALRSLIELSLRAGNPRGQRHKRAAALRIGKESERALK